MDNQEMDRYRRFIRDDFIWLYIFGKKRPRLDSMDAVLRAINNTINLTFVYVLSCVRDIYKNVEDIEEKKKTFNPNAKRAVKNIDRIYTELDVSFELINYILLDIQFDLSLGNSSCLKQYIPGISETFMPLDYSPLILRWMASSNPEGNTALEDIIRSFQRLIVSLPFLGSTRLTEEDSDICFDVQYGFESRKLYSDYKIYVQDCGRGIYQFYFLERVEVVPHACLLYYSTPDYTDHYLIGYHDESFRPEEKESETRVCRLMDPDELEVLCSCVTGAGPDSFFQDYSISGDGIHNIYAVNYKYLKNLSLSIADELGSLDNTVFRETILKKYGVVLAEDGDLDSVIFMKLIENTPTTVLYDLFYINGAAFHSVVRNLYRRFNGRISFRHVDFSRQPVDFSELDRFFLNTLHAGHRAIHKGELADLQANYIISMILSNNQIESRIATPIADDIDHIRIQKQLADAQDTLAQLLMRTCVFYSGVLAYGKEKMEYDAKHYDSMPSAEETAETQVKLHRCFLTAAKRTYGSEFMALQSNSGARFKLDHAIERFLALLERSQHNEAERCLRCVLGRSEIADNDLQLMLEGITDLDEDEQLKQIIDCLEFLSTGALENNEGRGEFNSAIYPITGKYRGNVESGDQCRIANFSARIDVDANGQFDFAKNIRILSEFNYQINEYYYCLPNIIRSNEDWWIDPLIIKACDFDSIFQKRGDGKRCCIL